MIRPGNQRVALLVLGFTLASTACRPFARWERAEEAVERLECGMSEDEVVRALREYGGLDLQVAAHPEPWDSVAVKGTTMIDLDFEQSSLRRVRVSWVDAIQHREFLPELDLCAEENEARGP